MVILATDGLLDNMYESDIVKCISEVRGEATPDTRAQVSKPPSAAELAGALARRAFDLSRDKERVTPWENEAVAAGVIPARKKAEAEEDHPPEWGWNVGQWGSLLERSFSSGLAGIRGFNGDGEDTKDPGRDRFAKMSESQMAAFRGGKTDDITVVVAVVGRVRRNRKRPVERDLLADSTRDEAITTSESSAHASADTR